MRHFKGFLYYVDETGEKKKLADFEETFEAAEMLVNLDGTMPELEKVVLEKHWDPRLEAGGFAPYFEYEEFYLPKPYERMIDDLEPDEVAKLKAVTLENLECEVIGTWTDDHERCVGVKINGVEVSFWWLTAEAAGAFEYPDSPKARQTIMEVLNDQLVDYGQAEKWPNKHGTCPDYMPRLRRRVAAGRARASHVPELRLERNEVKGTKMLWIVTGYSPKWDGFLFVIEAETEEAAYHAVAKLKGDVAFQAKDKFCDAPVWILDSEDRKLDDIEQVAQGNEIRAWYLCAEQVQVGCNHPDAVQW